MIKSINKKTSRRNFLKTSSLAAASFSIVPSYVMAGSGKIAPSDKINLGFIGVGRQGTGLGSRFFDLPETQIVAACDVDQTKLDRFVNDINQKYAEANGKGTYKGLKAYSKYEKLLKRKDIDGVVIATPDHWHAITSIDSMKAGKEESFFLLVYVCLFLVHLSTFYVKEEIDFSKRGTEMQPPRGSRGGYWGVYQNTDRRY